MEIEKFYRDNYGVCPQIEKDIPLHSHSDMISFAKKWQKQNDRHEINSIIDNLELKIMFGKELIKKTDSIKNAKLTGLIEGFEYAITKLKSITNEKKKTKIRGI